MPLSSNLKRKFFIYMALTGLVPLLVLAFQNHYFGKKAIEKLEIEHLNYSLKSRMLWLREWTRQTKKEFFSLGIQLSAKDARITKEDLTALDFAVQGLFNGHSKYKSLTVYDPNWSVIRQFNENPQFEIPPPSSGFKKKFVIPDIFLADRPFLTPDKDTILPLGQTVLDRNGHPALYIIGEMNMTQSLKRVLSDTSDLDESGKIYLVSGDGSLLYQASPAAYECPGTMIFPGKLLQGPYWQLQKRRDCRGVSVFSVAAPITEMDWILIVEVDKMHAMKEIERYRGIGSSTALAILILILIGSWRTASNVADPLDELARVARHISEGNHQERLPVFKDRYLNNVGEAFNAMLDTLDANKRLMIQTISLSAVGKLSSSIVHEMRNPLSSVKINLQALAHKVKEDPAYAEMASIAISQVKRLESMFSDLLHFSKPIQLNPEEVTFREIANEVQEILTQKAADKIISLEIIDNLGSTSITVDKKQVVQALINLVDNAIQWSPDNGTVQIIGEQAKAAGGFTIIIKDQGPGIREEQINNLFQPFYTTRETGTGLGLANVKKIVEFHGGSVFAGNNLGGGARFSMTFNERPR
ncbi:MAG: sensor histidine kinase [Proteobacteria bacterium]|nr:sensor histidine kinase [Pseudomonadota bacterium]MBU4295041.1 sensor histidine kinase [Pseudomonadota bacterium]MCG2746607.1 sensor histidine kinase [Desulfobulbaceae bacterium]